MVLDVDICDGDDIIKLETLRRKDRVRKGYHFFNDRRFEELTANARKQGAVILRGEEEVENYLDRRQADALTVEKVILFRQQVTLSEVLEEVHHFEQNLIGLNEDKDAVLRGILNEIEAKKFLLDNIKKYHIPRKEIEDTKKQLDFYERKLIEWKEIHHV